jgi:dihydrofolate reductase
VGSGRIVWHTTMSLDGFVAGPDDAMGWTFGAGLGPSPAASAMIEGTGAILAGRRWYDLSLVREDWAPYGGAWHGAILVLTHRPAAQPPGGGTVTFLGGDIRDAVETARVAAAGKDVVIFGPTVAHACLDAGVLDEILVHIVPVLLGDGVRFFDRAGSAEPMRLRRTEVAESGQLTDLRFAVGERDVE